MSSPFQFIKDMTIVIISKFSVYLYVIKIVKNLKKHLALI